MAPKTPAPATPASSVTSVTPDATITHETLAATLAKHTTAFTTSVVPHQNETKKSVKVLDPNDALIIGIDIGDETTPGYDSRVKLPLDETMVQSICKYGVVVPITVRRDGERYIVVSGRRRVMHARAANIRLAKAGMAPVRVTAEVRSGDEMTMMVINRVANSYAVKDAPFEEARHMQQAVDKGMSLPEVALMFGVSTGTVQDRMKLLDLAPEGVEAAKRGELSANTALELASLPQAEQLKIMVADAEAGGGKLDNKRIQAAARDAKAAQATAANRPVKKTPKQRVEAALAVITALADRAATGEKLTAADWEAALRKVALPLSDRKFDSLVKLAAANRDQEQQAS